MLCYSSPAEPGAGRVLTTLNTYLPYLTSSCLRSALGNEKETFTIYKTQLGEDHEKTKVSVSLAQLSFAPFCACKISHFVYMCLRKKCTNNAHILTCSVCCTGTWDESFLGCLRSQESACDTSPSRQSSFRRRWTTYIRWLENLHTYLFRTGYVMSK